MGKNTEHSPSEKALMGESKTEKELLSEVSAKLDVVIGIMMVSGMPQDEKLRVLRRRGHDWETIGDLVGLGAAAARMRLTRTKTKGGKKRTKERDGST